MSNPSRIGFITFDRNSNLLGVASGRTARLFDLLTLKEKFVLTGHDEGVSSVDFRPDGKRIVTGSSDQTVKLWDA